MVSEVNYVCVTNVCFSPAGNSSSMKITWKWLFKHLHVVWCMAHVAMAYVMSMCMMSDDDDDDIINLNNENGDDDDDINHFLFSMKTHLSCSNNKYEKENSNISINSWQHGKWNEVK